MSGEPPDGTEWTHTGRSRFSDADLNRGALFSWLIFVCLTAVLAPATQLLSGHSDLRIGFGGLPPTRIGALISGALLFGFLAALVAAPVALFGIPWARRLSRWLENEPSTDQHLLTFFAFGSVVGATWLIVVTAVCPGIVLASPLVILISLAAAVAVPSGWMLSLRCATRGAPRIDDPIDEGAPP